MTTQSRPHIKIVAETASTAAWPATDGDWDEQPLMDPISASEGAGQIIGEALIEQVLGNALQPGATSGGMVATVASLVRRYCRLLKRDGAGPITLSDGLTYSEFWWGTIEDAELDDTARKKTWRCNGIAGVLASIFLLSGVEVPGPWTAPPNTSDCGFLPLFNGVLTGDMSSATYTINGQTVHIFDRYNSSATPWTANEALKFLLATYAQPTLPGGTTAYGALSWVLDDSLGALTYRVEAGLNLNGATLLDAVNYLINPRRGLTWRVSVSGTTATITVCSTMASAITVGAYTLPASTQQFDVDTTDLWMTGLRLRETASTMMDVIMVAGAHPRTAISVGYGDPGDAGRTGKLFDAGWTGSQQTGSDPDNPTPYTEDVHRRLVIHKGWTGEQYDDSSIGIPADMAVSAAADASYGWGGLTGVRTYTAGGTPGTAPAWTLSLDGHLPVPAGYDLSSFAGPFDITKAELAPLVFVGVGSAWKDYSNKVSVRIEQSPPAVSIGHTASDRKFIRDELAAKDLVVTLSVRESHPLAVSWVNDPTTWPSDVPRMLLIQIPTAELWTILEGTAVGIDPGILPTLTTMLADVVVRDDRPYLREVLALARAWYGSAAVEGEYAELGAIDIDPASAPGALIGNVTTMNDGVKAANANVTRRSWNFRELQQQTKWNFERIVPDLQAST